MRRLIPLLAIAVLVVAACSSGGNSDLTGKTWQWTASTTKVPASQSVVPNPENYTIEFASDGTFESKADCNNVSGTYETSGSNGLTITLGASTRMACGDGSLSDIYLQELSKAASYEIADSQLVITLSDEGTMTFK